MPDGLPTSSDVANMSVLGFQPEKNYPGRGPIECASRGIELGPDDVAFRCNLVYASEDQILRDYSAGHIDNERARRLMEDLQKEFGSHEVTFYSGVSYRNLLVLHGKRFSAAVNYFKPDSSADIPLAELKSSPADDSPEARDTVAFLHDLEERCAAFLAAHELNANESSPANRIWPWSPGHKPAFNSFADKYQGRSAAVITAVDVISGIGACAGMDVIKVPGVTGYLDTNYAGKANAAIAAIEDHDFVYVHLEAIDECSHEGSVELKMRAISDFENRIVKPVMTALAGRNVTFAVLPDHPVPYKQRIHTRTPVPFAVCGPHIKPDGVMHYSEADAPNGSLGYMTGEAVVRTVLNLK